MSNCRLFTYTKDENCQKIKNVVPDWTIMSVNRDTSECIIVIIAWPHAIMCSGPHPYLNIVGCLGLFHQLIVNTPCTLTEQCAN